MSGFRVEFFDIWQAGYGGASVAVYVAGTTTLANLYTDEALTAAAANPQTLMAMSQDGVSYGKFAAPVYTGSTYEMVVNSTDETGVIRAPITTLDAQNASKATAKAANGSVNVELEDWLARIVHAENHGVILPSSDPNASAATNTATIVAAIGAAAAKGGGAVLVGAGIFVHNPFTGAAGVIVTGLGADATTLQSTAGSAVATLSGDRGGFANITLDGASKIAGSIGVFSKANDETVLENVLIKRFVTGMKYQGGRYAEWDNLKIDGCTSGALLYGDNDASGGANGDEFRHNHWSGGIVSNCTGVGVELKYIDKKCWHNTLSHIGFNSNTGVALRVFGARWTDLEDKCWFNANTTAIAVQDGTDTTLVAENSVVGLRMNGGLVSSNMTFTGKCQDVIFDGVDFSGGTYTLTTVGNTILAKNCIEGSAVVLAGNDATQWMRCRDILGDAPASTGVTTDAVATEAWSYDLAPGERVYLEATVIGNSRNSDAYASYHIARPAHRPASTLAYDGQTVNFTLGATLTGGTSGATARILADVDAGATGTLTLRDIIGEFIDDEAITDSSGGAAIANGVLAHQNAALLGATTDVAAAPTETVAGWAVDFGVTAGKVRVMVTGAAATTCEWTVSVRVTSG